MATIVQMPKLGLTMVEGKVTKWLKTEGDYVEKGEGLFEVATDKISNEVESISSGYLKKIIVDEGDTIEVNGTVAIIGEKNEDISMHLGESDDKKQFEKEEETQNEYSKGQNTEVEMLGNVKASPLAKKLSKNNNIDLTLIIGTGPNGRIVEKDILTYLESNKVKASPMAKKIADKLNVDLTRIEKDNRIMKEDVYKYHSKKSSLDSQSVNERRVPMSEMRKVIARRMHESWITSPAVSYSIKVDMSQIKKLKANLSRVHKLTYTDIFVKIVAQTLIENPYMNSSIDNDEIILRDYVNIGVAVALDEGLIVPVIKHADRLSLRELSENLKVLGEKAKNGELESDEITGGTFTISNLGMFGMESFTPIINQPEVGIIGLNTIESTPIIKDGEITSRPIMNINLTADHRVIDGAIAAQFLSKLKEYIENPEMLLL